VSLLGRAAPEVSVGSVRLGDGQGAWLRGVAVASGVDAGGATGVRIDAVRIDGGANGLRAGPGSGVSITRSEIHASQDYGLLVVGASSVSFEDSLVKDTKGPGLWSQCDAMLDPCACPTKPVVTLHRVLFSRPSYEAVHFAGTVAVMNDVAIADVQPIGDTIQQGGGGLSVSGCSTMEYGGVSIGKAPIYGMLVDGSSVAPTSGLEAVGIIIIDSKPGMWVQNTDDTHSVVLQGLSIDQCHGTGLGVDTDAKGIIIIDSKVANTILTTVPVAGVNGGPPGEAELGLGVAWKSGAAMIVEGLTVGGNATQGVLIDGAVGANSSINKVTLEPGDEEGIIQQQVTAMAQAPGGDASVSQTAEKVSEVPVAPTL
jgi:hypothetical protein